MKKVFIFLSLSLLLAGTANADSVVITSFSQIVEGHRYTIQAVDTARGALFYNEAVDDTLCSTGKYGVAYDPTSPAQQWTFVADTENGYYLIKNVEAGKFINSGQSPWLFDNSTPSWRFKAEKGSAGGFILKSSLVGST